MSGNCAQVVMRCSRIVVWRLSLSHVGKLLNRLDLWDGSLMPPHLARHDFSHGCVGSHNGADGCHGPHGTLGVMCFSSSRAPIISY